MRRWLVLPIAVLTLSACRTGSYSHLYSTKPHAPSFTDDQVSNMDVMGPVVVDRGTNFAVYSQNAERIELLLFDDPESDTPTKQFPMTRIGDVWSLYVEGVGIGQHYGYVAWGPNWHYDPAWYPGSNKGFVADVDALGNRFDPNKLLDDPYCKSLHRDHDWSRGSLATGPKRDEPTWAAASKCVVIASQYSWSPGESSWRTARAQPSNPGHDWRDLVIYEVHPKGFTMEPASGVTHPGTFSGIGEKADYLADLGVTAVELMPVHEKPLDGGYWGYWTLNFFAPEITFSATHDPLKVTDEFKWMVDQLHQHGIEVILDVVYNHTGEGGLWRERQYTDDVSLDPGTDGAINVEPKAISGLYSYRGLDNQSYYALSPDNQTFWNNTGVGHETRPNNRPMKKLILDSLEYWVNDMHVDGFRFDLAGVLGEKDHDYNNWDVPANTVLQSIIDDPVLQSFNTRVIAEPWTAGGNYGSLIGAYPDSTNKPGTGWGEWNGHFRDWWRDMVNNDSWLLNSQEGGLDGGGSLTGSSSQYAYNGRKPYHSVNYVSCHDGMTMYDLMSYAVKNNGCGPLNPVCCDHPNSAWCEAQNGDDNNRSRDWGPATDATAEATKRQMMRDLFSAMLIAHGTPMLYGGDEWMRTQYGNNNAYSTGADNTWNWFRWGEWTADDARQRMHDFVKQMVRVRKTHEYAFAPSEYAGSTAPGAPAPFAWKDTANADKTSWADRTVAIHYYDPSYGPQLYVIVNMARTPVDFTLPTGVNWGRIVDTQTYFDSDAYIAANSLDPKKTANVTLDDPVVVPGPTYGAQGSSIVILQALP